MFFYYKGKLYRDFTLIQLLDDFIVTTTNASATGPSFGTLVRSSGP